jgi:hypothetical protein
MWLLCLYRSASGAEGLDAMGKLLVEFDGHKAWGRIRRGAVPVGLRDTPAGDVISWAAYEGAVARVESFSTREAGGVTVRLVGLWWYANDVELLVPGDDGGATRVAQLPEEGGVARALNPVAVEAVAMAMVAGNQGGVGE